MTPEGNGRFCSHCSKSVIDFTHRSDAQLHQFLSKGQNSICGRFTVEQVGRQIKSAPIQRHKWYRMAAAVGFILIFGGPATVAAFPAPPFSYEQKIDSPAVKKPEASLDTVGISGYVTDSKNVPLINASVILKQGDSLMGGTITDFDGLYKFDKLKPGKYSLETSYIGYNRRTVNDISFNGFESTFFNIVMLRGKTQGACAKTIYGKTKISNNPHK